MENEINRINELAPCGVYCGACPSFNKSCKGCSSDDKEQDRSSKWYCKIRVCCYDIKGFDFCIDCEDFPCKIINKKLLSTHQDNPKYTYRHEIPSVFVKLKTMKTQEYLDFQKNRWKCDSCDGTIYFYHYKCDTCGKEKMIY